MSRTLSPPADAIAITGFMGTGKSTVGRLLAERLNMEFVDTDELIESATGVLIPEIFAEQGEEHFRHLESQALEEALAAPRRVISTGGGILLRERNRDLLRAAGPIVCLTATPETIVARIASDSTRPLLQVADPEVRIGDLLLEREAFYAEADYHVATDGLTPEGVCDAILAVLADDSRARWQLHVQTMISLDVEGASYTIRIGRGVLDKAGVIYPPCKPGLRAAVVTTDRIAPLLGERAMKALAAGGWEAVLFTVPDGEASKSLEVLGRLYEQFAGAGLDRGNTVFALGGGVIGDLAGFAAATYMRGIDLVHLPTTLLAQVDSSIGGKTAVDLSAGKNLVGAFHQPRAVISDVGVLASLPPGEMRSGFGEIIKHACCFDAGLFAYLERLEGRLPEDGGAALEYLVSRNCQIKAQVVQEDPTEQGARAVLNYGHTVGHALERSVSGWALRHGEVVGAGIVAEARLACWLGIAGEETAARQERLIAAWGLPTSVAEVDEPTALRALERDKKITAGRLRLPLVPEIGRFEIIENVDIDLVRRALRSVLR